MVAELCRWWGHTYKSSSEGRGCEVNTLRGDRYDIHSDKHGYGQEYKHNKTPKMTLRHSNNMFLILSSVTTKQRCIRADVRTNFFWSSWTTSRGEPDKNCIYKRDFSLSLELLSLSRFTELTSWVNSDLLRMRLNRPFFLFSSRRLSKGLTFVSVSTVSLTEVWSAARQSSSLRSPQARGVRQPGQE